VSGGAVIGCELSLFLCDDESVCKLALQLVMTSKRYSVTEAGRRDAVVGSAELQLLRILDVVRPFQRAKLQRMHVSKEKKRSEQTGTQVSPSG
jgi:hypothetical protein